MSKPESLISEPSLNKMTELALLTPRGCLVEIGVYKGGSAWYLQEVARKQKRRLHLFDTFTGIPRAGEYDSHKVGDFADTDLSTVRKFIPDAEFHVGIFPNTLNFWHENIAFAHIDCDQYQTVRDCFAYLLPWLVRGGIMWFDDYTNLPGVTRAIKECWSDQLYTFASQCYLVKS